MNWNKIIRGFIIGLLFGGFMLIFIYPLTKEPKQQITAKPKVEWTSQWGNCVLLTLRGDPNGKGSILEVSPHAKDAMLFLVERYKWEVEVDCLMVVGKGADGKPLMGYYIEPTLDGFQEWIRGQK